MEQSGSEAPHKNIARLLAVLEELSHASAEGLRLTDLARAAGLGKTTAHRILGGLEGHGLIEQDAETGRYFLGLKMLVWAAAARNRFGIARLAEPVVERLARQTQDTVYLVARSGDESVCLDRREGSFPIRALTLNVGDRRPLGIGAGSLAMLAFLPDPEVDRIMAAHAVERAAFPFSDDRIRQMIEAARRNGYAYNDVHVFQGMETITDMAAIAVPVRRGDGTPVAALHVTAITSRLAPPRREEIVTLAAAEARRLEAEYRPVLDAMRVPGLAA